MAKGKETTSKAIDKSGPTGFVFFVAWFGALIYFAEKASGLGELIVAFLQACVWPAYVLYHVLSLLNV